MPTPLDLGSESEPTHLPMVPEELTLPEAEEQQPMDGGLLTAPAEQLPIEEEVEEEDGLPPTRRGVTPSPSVSEPTIVRKKSARSHKNSHAREMSEMENLIEPLSGTDESDVGKLIGGPQEAPQLPAVLEQPQPTEPSKESALFTVDSQVSAFTEGDVPGPSWTPHEPAASPVYELPKLPMPEAPLSISQPEKKGALAEFSPRPLTPQASEPNVSKMNTPVVGFDLPDLGPVIPGRKLPNLPITAARTVPAIPSPLSRVMTIAEELAHENMVTAKSATIPNYPGCAMPEPHMPEVHIPHMISATDLLLSAIMPTKGLLKLEHKASRRALKVLGRRWM